MMAPEEISKQKAYFLISLLGLSILVTSVGVTELVSSLKNGTKNTSQSITTTEGFTKKFNFPNPPLLAKAALVYDLNTGEVLFEKNARAQLPLASLTKIMVALTAADVFPRDAVVTVHADSLTQKDGGFRDGQEWRLQDILEATLVKSTNDGATTIAAAYGAFRDSDASNPQKPQSFLEAMNKKAKDLGLSETYFLNETGLDESSTVSGAYGSAEDVAKLFETAVLTFPKAFEGTSYDTVTVSSIGKTLYTLENTNEVANQIPGLIASKTGYTDLAQGNLVILFDLGPMHPIAVVVLGSTREGRFTDTLGLVDSTLRYFKDSNHKDAISQEQ